MTRKSEVRRFSLYEEFATHVGLINDETRLEKLGLEPREDGRFDPTQLDELRAFVKANDAFHIVTQTDEDGAFKLDNRSQTPNPICHYLADGSADPAVLVAGSA